MNYWSYNAPEVGVVTLSEKEIIDSFYPFWYRKMVKKYGSDYVEANFSQVECIEDWAVVHWAWKVDG